MESIKAAAERIVDGVVSGEMKEAVAIMILQNLAADYTGDQRSTAFICEKINDSLRRWNQNEPLA